MSLTFVAAINHEEQLNAQRNNMHDWIQWKNAGNLFRMLQNAPISVRTQKYKNLQNNCQHRVPKHIVAQPMNLPKFLKNVLYHAKLRH